MRVLDDRILRRFTREFGVKLSARQRQVQVLRGTRDGLRRVQTLEVSAALSTLGLKGGLIAFAMSFLKSMCFEKNGWRLISSAPFTPSRCAGSRVSRPVRSDLASGEISSPNLSGSVKIWGQMSGHATQTPSSCAKTTRLLIHLVGVLRVERRQP